MTSSLDGQALEKDPRGEVRRSWPGAVLLADEIEYYASSPDIPAVSRLVEPFDLNRLRPASYQLTLGREVHVGGEHRILGDSEPLILQPHQVAVVSTHETIRIPRFLIARWSLRVEKIYEGLLWTGGPQVDPGWVGQLPCPIYNLAEREVELRYRDPLFTIDFVRTTAVTPEYTALSRDRGYDKTWFKPVRRTLSEHDSHRIHSAPFEALRDLRELTRFREFATGLIGMILVVLTVLIAAMGVLVATPFFDDYIGSENILAYLVLVSLTLSIVSFLLVLCSNRPRFRR